MVKKLGFLVGIALVCAACGDDPFARIEIRNTGTSSFPGYSQCVNWQTVVGTSNYNNAFCPNSGSNAQVIPTTSPGFSQGIQPTPGTVDAVIDIYPPWRTKK